MPQPYVSSRRLVANSLSAMLAAIEVYNKPRMEYRDEVTVLLVVNAWELALKAVLKKAGLRIFYKKRRGEAYRTLTAEDALKQALNHKLFPPAVDRKALAANVRVLIEYRNRATHLYAGDLAEIIYPFLQTSVLNYRDLMFDNFQKDLADSITWQLLPLGAKAPSGPVQFMKSNPSASTVAEVQEFIDDLRSMVDQAAADGADLQRMAAVYDVHLRSAKAVSSSDLVVSVAKEGGRVVVKKSDPNHSHPYTTNELLDRVNAKRKGRPLNSRDHQALCWKENLRDNTRMAWKHAKGVSYTWSGEAVSHMVGLDDAYFDRVRTEYSAELRRRRRSSTPSRVADPMEPVHLRGGCDRAGGRESRSRGHGPGVC
ncbi:DUF3644 domain-containing protein [Brachybacterium sp. MASK1Z-5]|uniref:DUF3644 domain-containing protein n=1 Tax=Brachybacterium halotolerans TaxID=2795215 RepID=A0ABS1BD24_9MICO|nr:DUF3644 domain-containing protein [Brachybacterium halotolerans]MBK0332504.1 DUF3644 domain-containing protein [Brachybacterium halotolerans]